MPEHSGPITIRELFIENLSLQHFVFDAVKRTKSNETTCDCAKMFQLLPHWLTSCLVLFCLVLSYHHYHFLWFIFNLFHVFIFLHCSWRDGCVFVKAKTRIPMIRIQLFNTWIQWACRVAVFVLLIISWIALCVVSERAHIDETAKAGLVNWLKWKWH